MSTAWLHAAIAPIGVLSLSLMLPATLHAQNTAFIGNQVWLDLNGNGVQEPEEPGVANVTVQLWNPNKTQLHGTTTSNAQGIYTLQTPSLPGTFRIRVLLPFPEDQFSPMDASHNDLTDSDIHPDGPDFGFSAPILVPSNVVSTVIWDAGIVRHINGQVWNDHNHDGLRGHDEIGLGDVEVRLTSPSGAEIFTTATTDATGRYQMLIPALGSYRVQVIPPLPTDGFSPHSAGGNPLLDSDIHPSGEDAGFSDIITLADATAPFSVVDAGIIRAAIPVTGKVWNDYDADGLQAPDEPGLMGVQVRLTSADKSRVIKTTVTDAQGAFLLPAPGPADYRIEVSAIGQSVFSPLHAGDASHDSDVHPDGIDAGFTHVFQLDTALESIGAGMQPEPLILGDFIWADENRNGRQDIEEVGLPDVTVELWNAQRSLLLGTTSSSATGHYVLTAPGFGSYVLRLQLPHGYFPSAQNAAAPTVDNDFAATSAIDAFTSVLDFPAGTTHDPDIDAGLIKALIFCNGFEAEVFPPPVDCTPTKQQDPKVP